jgi:hypothetical protein
MMNDLKGSYVPSDIEYDQTTGNPIGRASKRRRAVTSSNFNKMIGTGQFKATTLMLRNIRTEYV